MTFLVTLFSLRDLAPERSRFSSQLVAGRTLKMDTLRSSPIQLSAQHLSPAPSN